VSKQNLNKGKIGENKACQYLSKLGYQIIEKNFQKRYGEIDLICLDKNVLVFVEVKTRYSHEYGSPEEAVTPAKIKTLIRSANFYKMLHPELPELMRIDVIAIDLSESGSKQEIRHIKNIT
jgi:putative endonuclease